MKSRLLAHYQTELVEAGCDEAGRGCLAGPVFAAAVILPKNFSNSMLNDSKQLSEKKRNELRVLIEEQAIAWAVEMVDIKIIDRYNILNASIFGMHQALDKLQTRPELVLVDGNRFKKYQTIPHKCIVKGDGKYFSIAAASVLAKTYRDEYMKKLSHTYPVYNWAQNKGYPTKAHRIAIAEHGITPHHRQSFRLNYRQLTLDFKD